MEEKRKIRLNENYLKVYQPWVIKTYGDMAKTKTITIKKHERILKALSGLEQNKPDSSKFRFWVKAKGDKPNLFTVDQIF